MGWMALSYVLAIMVCFMAVPNETTLCIGMMFIFLGMFIYWIFDYFLLSAKEFFLKEYVKGHQDIINYLLNYLKEEDSEDDEDSENVTEDKKE